ncbi:hypothetical protein PTTG_26578 [Puccinia triticina 1-1 BBBD Race 1]|uniref:Uncharacterized protein n=1 Tax=Puccinia triticina (isolate 1-1 / race 1 (BBBD)) TaxID=630390 RepID=A0A180GTQ9_PUCT1|nr:hypothetical protein PTTG_26578 [Puccinia triticina 1-1 BBBD Race 1]
MQSSSGHTCLFGRNVWVQLAQKSLQVWPQTLREGGLPPIYIQPATTNPPPIHIPPTHRRIHQPTTVESINAASASASATRQRHKGRIPLRTPAVTQSKSAAITPDRWLANPNPAFHHHQTTADHCRVPPATNPPLTVVDEWLHHPYAHVNPESPQVVIGISALGITHWTIFKEFKASELVSHGIPKGPA